MKNGASQQDAKFLNTLDAETREKLRRVCLVSTESEHVVAQKVGCIGLHVVAMRRRLKQLGVLPQEKVIVTSPQPKAPPKNAKPSKYRNADLFEDGPSA